PPASASPHRRSSAVPKIKFASIPQNNPPEHPADNSPHAPAQQDDDGSPAATGTHPGRGQGDGSQSASPNFANNGSPQSAHAIGEDTSVPAALAGTEEHGVGDEKRDRR